MNNTYLEINLDSFLENVDMIKKYVGGKTIIPVIKANAYGTFINKNIDILKRFDIVAVARVSEGVAIRKVGYERDILILNQPFYDEIGDIKKYNLVVGLSSLEFLDNCLKNDDYLRVHLEIETGMNRTGIFVNDLDEIMKRIINSKIHIEGAYTHFSSADFDKPYTDIQINKFMEALKIISSYNVDLEYIHTSASNGILNYHLDFTNAVRPGLIMYGYESFDGASSIIPIKKTCRLMSKIVFLKEVEEGALIGYSQNYKCSKKSLIATIPIGYGDGLPRNLSNRGFVFINGRKVPIIGNVCMDSIMVDVSNIVDVKVGDTVEIFGDNISLEEYSKMCDTINYEALCTIQDRVNRVFIGGDSYE